MKCAQARRERNTTAIKTSEPPTKTLTTEPTSHKITSDVLHILDEFTLMVPQASTAIARYARGGVQV